MHVYTIAIVERLNLGSRYWISEQVIVSRVGCCQRENGSINQFLGGDSTPSLSPTQHVYHEQPQCTQSAKPERAQVLSTTHGAQCKAVTVYSIVFCSYSRISSRHSWLNQLEWLLVLRTLLDYSCQFIVAHQVLESTRTLLY